MATTEMVHLRVNKRVKQQATAAMREARKGGMPAFHSVSDMIADFKAGTNALLLVTYALDTPSYNRSKAVKSANRSLTK